MMNADVVIAGGGLAGAATALQLARAGIDVIVVDRAAFPREKACGEGLLPHGVEVLTALGCAELLRDAPTFRGILYRCHGVVANGDFESGALGRGVRRSALDDGLRKKARAAGARLVEGNVIGIDGSALVLGDGKRIQGRVLVGADGPRSIVRHALGLDGGTPRRPRYALRGHFRIAGPLPDRVEVDVQGGFELYVTPIGANVVGVAALCEKDLLGTGGTPADRLRALIDRAPAVRDRLDNAALDDDVLACGPLRVRARGVWRDNVVLVGDAAGYVDAITGEGMSLGLRTAELCVTAIRDVLEGRDAAFARYASERAKIFRDHTLLTHGLVTLARRRALAKRAVARLAKEPELFSRLLAVNDGRRTLASLGALDLLKLAVGA